METVKEKKFWLIIVMKKTCGCETVPFSRLYAGRWQANALDESTPSGDGANVTIGHSPTCHGLHGARVPPSITPPFPPQLPSARTVSQNVSGKTWRRICGDLWNKCPPLSGLARMRIEVAHAHGRNWQVEKPISHPCALSETFLDWTRVGTKRWSFRNQLCWQLARCNYF